MQTVLKPNFLVVPQLAHSELAGNRASLRTFCSAGVNDMAKMDELDGRVGEDEGGGDKEYVVTASMM